MRRIVDLHEEIDEVNYFLKEWQRLASEQQIDNAIIRKPEIKFVSHTLERVIDTAQILDVPVILQTGKRPVVAKKDRRPLHRPTATTHTWLIPSSSKITLNKYKKLSTSDGKKLSYVGNDNGLLSLRTLANTIAHGGKLQLGRN